MDVGAALDLLLDACRLKCVPRAGWVMRGVSEAESVADHTFGVAFVSLLLCELVERPVDRAKVLTVALLHDLPESATGDVPRPAAAHFPAGAKREAESSALSELLRTLPAGDQWRSWWREFEEGSSPEGRLVRDADRLDMMIQAYVYERTTGNRCLAEFWESTPDSAFEFPAARALCEVLRARREQDE